MKSTKQPKKEWTSEEIQEAKDRHHEKMKKEGKVLSSEEFNSLMNYYDDTTRMERMFDRLGYKEFEEKVEGIKSK